MADRPIVKQHMISTFLELGTCENIRVIRLVRVIIRVIRVVPVGSAGW